MPVKHELVVFCMKTAWSMCILLPYVSFTCQYIIHESLFVNEFVDIHLTMEILQQTLRSQFDEKGAGRGFMDLDLFKYLVHSNSSSLKGVFISTSEKTILCCNIIFVCLFPLCGMKRKQT